MNHHGAMRRASRWSMITVLLTGLVGCSSAATPASQTSGAAATAATPQAPTPVCGQVKPGPSAAPPGAVTVDPAVVMDLTTKVAASPPGTTFWLAPGKHTLGTYEYSQIQPKDRDVFLGAPGAVLDGSNANRYAFTGTASDVTIQGLTVRGFVAPANEGVVNHDSGNGWILADNTIEDNRGAALMAGAHQQVRGNCLRDNGQYGVNAYQPGNGIVGLVIEGNEIVGNNTDDWEAKLPGCGCTGGVKFWGVNGADIRNNWIHANHGPGLWGDTNNNDFLIEDNVIEDNDGEAVFYETSYNLILRNNLIRHNTIPAGRTYAQRKDNFPVGTVYISESGGEPRIPARTTEIDIHDNIFQDNWSGITAWENADRFCNSAANTSTGSCTLLVKDVAACSQPGIAKEPLYSDCRWKTQRVDIHDNTFIDTPSKIGGCAAGYSGRMAVISNVGTFPEWSPYKGDVIQKAIAFDQQVRWRDNSYVGPWTFLLASTGAAINRPQWQAAPGNQDAGSTFKSPNLGC